MNELINYIILGMIQGLTEFFPVSSSGHLVLFQDFLKIKNEGASAEIIAHFGTLFSILLFYKASFLSSKNENDFFNPDTIKLLVISTIPAIIFGLIFDFEQFFNYEFVQYSLLANGVLIILMSLLKNSFSFNFNFKSALLLGIFQSIAILPGISRSGMVISSALMLGLNKEKEVYNINADTAAGAIAKKLKARRLIILSDVEGVLDNEKKLISEIDTGIISELIKDGTINSGMIPKIKNCLDVANNGVKGVVIIDGRKKHSILFELLSENGSGTLIRK